MAIETPFAIHSEYVSSKAVDQCLEFFNNNKSLHVKGQIGKKGNIDKTRKKSPLIIPKNSLIINNVNRTIDDVLNQMLEYTKSIINKKMP